MSNPTGTSGTAPPGEAQGLQLDLRPRDLPMPSQAAIRLIQACTRTDVTSEELGELAASDPALAAELLRVANSPFYGLGREIRTASRAATVLGHRAVRNLVLCVAVRDALTPRSVPGLDPIRHWEDALRRAVSAKLLGKEVGLDADECFTIGLLQDCGLLVMCTLWPDKASEWSRLLACDPDRRYRLERELFGVTHDQVAARLAAAWGLPEDIGALLEHHHEALGEEPTASRGKDKARAVLYCADWLAAVYAVEDKNAAIDACRRLLARHFELDAEASDQLLAQVPRQIEKAALALELKIGSQPDFQEVLRVANLRLSEENLSYQELTMRLENALRERDALAVELNREIELAREIQRSLLPRPTSDEDPVIGINVPARDLSGDFFDYFALADGDILFNLGDVSGKGMNAALLMAKTTSLFRCLGKRIHDPTELLAQINNEICETTIRGMFVTMVAGLYRPRTDTVCLVSAGHPPALLFREGRLHGSYGAKAPPLGVVENMSFAAEEIDLDGGSLYMFSDGITEARRAGDGPLGIDGLVAMIGALGDAPLRECLSRMVENLRSEPLVLRDDMTVLVVGSRPRAGGAYQATLRIAAEAGELKAMRGDLKQILQCAALPAESLNELVIAVNEACMNVIQHGYGKGGAGDIVLKIAIEPDRLVFRLRDLAAPVDAATLKPRDLAVVRPGGLGLCLMHKVMDEVRYLPPPDGRGNLLEMVKHRGSPQA